MMTSVPWIYDHAIIPKIINVPRTLPHGTLQQAHCLVAKLALDGIILTNA
jgi:hypothetical protein